MHIMTASCWILLRMRNVPDNLVQEVKINISPYPPPYIFQKIMPFVSDVKIYCIAEQDTEANIMLHRIDALCKRITKTKIQRYVHSAKYLLLYD